MNPEIALSQRLACTLQYAILLYRGNESPFGGSGHKHAANAATFHEVRRGVIAPGVPITTEALEILSQLRPGETDAANEAQGRSLFHPHLLYASPASLIWWKPAHRSPIYFKCTDTQAPLLHPLNGKSLGHPPLLFRYAGHDLSVWALGKDQRPRLNTRLYCAPYLNIYPGGKICVAGDLPQYRHSDSIPKLEEAFFDTYFTHNHYPHSPCKGLLHELYQRMARPGGTCPSSALRRLPLTLRSILHETTS